MKLSVLANHLEGSLLGDPNLDIKRISSLDEANPGDLSFVLDKGHLEELKKANASVYITFKEIDGLKQQIVVKNPRKALAQAIDLFHPAAPLTPQTEPLSSKATISESAIIDIFTKVGDHSQIGENTQIHSHVSIGKNVNIGKNCLIYANVSIYDNIHIGDNVIIHAGASIGSDGFGYYPEGQKWIKIQHIGSVIIENNCEIGPNTCIDRGCLGNTLIQEGTKIDNLVHIAHNNQIGKNCAIAGQVGFVGSAKLEDNVSIGGQCGIDRVVVGHHTVIASRSGVTKDIPAKSMVSGFPARNHREEMAEKAAIRHWIKKKKALN